ncbi:MAG: hypothetical protein KH416_09515 [Dialister sp.]|uniref:ABC transporter permease n=1 Tax=Eisenbergiella massiliensis TaxID=1720294 RepID=A0A3E3I6F4_9FIRM|nr:MULTISPECIES: hypothetical protein [Bacillota]MBS6296346.1 hypothetical protein [Dialister sp.]RGE61613.1 hypothetical protein DWY69_29280 [Eisenbergiella massiliensis]
MRAVRPLVLCSIGGLLYVLCEFIFRGRSHWTMFLVGGLCFWLIGLINEVIPWEMPLWKQCIIGAVIITTVEFIAGCIINIGLGWQVWDYSGLPFNIMGQVCLPFAVLWVVVAAVGIVLDDYLRYWIFRQEKPLYKLF